MKVVCIDAAMSDLELYKVYTVEFIKDGLYYLKNDQILWVSSRFENLSSFSELEQICLDKDD